MLLLRSLIYNFLFYLMMALMGIGFAPLAIWSRGGALWAMHRYTDVVLWMARVICGLRFEVRGEIPQGNVLIAAKHQSFLDILILAHVLPRFNFIMKKELKWAPILGLYAMRIGAVPVDRGKKGQAVTKMVSDIEEDQREPRQLVIYPQGTRVEPGAAAPYKIGAWHLYRAHGLPCIPAAVNTGAFWPRKGIVRRPGHAVIEFLPAMAPGMEADAFLSALETTVETKSARLLAEARAQLSD